MKPALCATSFTFLLLAACSIDSVCGQTRIRINSTKPGSDAGTSQQLRNKDSKEGQPSSGRITLPRRTTAKARELSSRSSRKPQATKKPTWGKNLPGKKISKSLAAKLSGIPEEKIMVAKLAERNGRTWLDTMYVKDTGGGKSWPYIKSSLIEHPDKLDLEEKK